MTEDEWVLSRLSRLFAHVEPGMRLMLGRDDEVSWDRRWFACIDYPPPDDHGPLAEAPLPMSALMLLAHRVLKETA